MLGQKQRERILHRQTRWNAGQSSSETIIVIVLVALTVLVAVRLYGARVGGAFLCAAKSIASGEGFTTSCGGEGGSDGDPVETALNDELPVPPGGESGASGAAPKPEPEDADGGGEEKGEPGQGDFPEGLPGSGPGGAARSSGGAPARGSNAAGGAAGSGGGGESASGEPDPIELPAGLPPLPDVGDGSGTGGSAPQGPNSAGSGGGGGGSDRAEPADAGPAGGLAGAPAPGGGSGSGSAARGTAQDRLQEARDLLASTAKGKELLQFLDDKKITIKLQGGDGSVYDSSTGTIILNDAKSAEDLALTIAHEGNHALFDKEGRSADAATDTRDEFVRKMIEEETVGTVASIETKKDLQATGKTITARYPLEREYNQAFDKAVADLKKSNPKATAAELDAAGKKAGFDAVRKGFETGKVVTSNTKETYPEYYGKEFDRVRANLPAGTGGAKPEPVSAGAPLPGTAQQRLEEARKLLRMTDSGSSALGWLNGYRQPVGGIGYSKTAQEIKIEFMPGTGAIYDADQKKIFVGQDQTAQEMALGVLQAQEWTIGSMEPAKMGRSEYVERANDKILSGTIKRIKFKRDLQAKGINVTATVPLEQEYDNAYKITFAKELPRDINRDVRDIGPSAKYLADLDGYRAVKDAFNGGKPIDGKTRQQYSEYFGGVSDTAKAQQAKLDQERAERSRIAAEKQAKIDAGRKALAELVNAVDPKSPAADQVIQLVNAFLVQHGGTQATLLTTDAREGLKRLLSPYGFKDIDAVGSFQNEQARLDYALANFAVLNERQREQLRTGRALPEGFGIETQITYEEMQAREDQKVLYNMGDGTSIQITRRERREAEERAFIRHTLQQLNSIRNAGPGALVGRIVGCAREGVAMGPCGEKEAAIGGAIDTALTIYAPVRARANMKANIRDMPSGGNVVRGGPGGAELQPLSRPPPVRNRAEEMPRPGQPAPRGRPLDATQPQVAFDKTVGQPAPRGRPLDATQPKVAFDKTQPGAPPKPKFDKTQPGSPPPPPKPQSPKNAPPQEKPVPKDAKTGGGREDSVAEGRQRLQEKSQRQAEERQREAERVKNIPPPRFRPSTRPDDGKSISVDEALNRLAKGENVVVTENKNFHQQVFNDIKGLDPKAPKSQQPKAPDAFIVGNGARLDASDITKAQGVRLISLLRARENATGGSGGSGLRDTGNKTQVGPAPGPQSPAGPPNTNRTEQKTVPGQQTGRVEQKTDPGQRTGRIEQKTGEITKPGAAQDRVTKPDTGAPGKFSRDDVAFGISRPDGKTDALAKFAGQAKDGGKISISDKTRNPPPDTPKGVVNAAVAKETVAEAKVFLNASGGNLRFSLQGFDVKQALKPGSPNFDAVTSHEFRQVLKDPFFRSRVRFYDGKGKDVTGEILKLQVP